MISTDSKSLMRDTGVADLLGCSKATVWRRVADGTIPQPIKIGGMSRWTQPEILAVIDEAKSRRRTILRQIPVNAP